MNSRVESCYSTVQKWYVIFSGYLCEIHSGDDIVEPANYDVRIQEIFER